MKTSGVDFKGDVGVCHLGKWRKGSRQSEQLLVSITCEAFDKGKYNV